MNNVPFLNFLAALRVFVCFILLFKIILNVGSNKFWLRTTNPSAAAKADSPPTIWSASVFMVIVVTNYNTYLTLFIFTNTAESDENVPFARDK